MSIMKRLRDETKADHEHLETFPYFKAMAEHSLPLACYVNQLKGLAIIHGVLESELATGRLHCPDITGGTRTRPAHC